MTSPSRRVGLSGGGAVLGLVLLVVGAGMIVVGARSSDSVADKVHETFTGRFTQTTTWYFLGGAGAAVAGLALLARRHEL